MFCKHSLQPQSPLALNLISCLPGPYLTIRMYQDIYILFGLTAKVGGLQTKMMIVVS